MPHIELSLQTLRPGVAVRVENGCTGIVVIRNEDSVSAFEDACPHAQWRLSDGEVCAGVLQCPGHAWEFDIDTGRCLNVSAYWLRRFEVTVSGDVVSIEWPGAPHRLAQTTHAAQAFL